jgi:hypothetical protein
VVFGTRLRWNCDFYREMNTTKSGAREPAVGRETRLRRYECDCSENRRQYVGRSPLPSRAAIPRGAYAPRSWSGMRALRESCVFQLQGPPEHRCVRERAQHTCIFHLQTPYVHHGWRTPSASGCVCGRCCRCTILADEKDAFPRGLTPPRSWSPVQRASAGRMTIFAMNKRTFKRARAAGVSPPWVGRHVYAGTSAIARKTADSMWADHRCHRVQRYHGGLTPPALGCTTFVRCEKRHSGCTNARSQERRASARRGNC